MASNALTVSQFPRLENLVDAMAPGDSIYFPAQVSSDGAFLKHVERLDRHQGLKTKIFAYVAAGSAALTALATAAFIQPLSEPLIGAEFYAQIWKPAMIGAALGGVAFIIAASLEFYQLLDKLDTHRTREHARKLAEDGFVFASELTRNLLPLQATDTSYVHILHHTLEGHAVEEFWYAVRPSGATVYRADLGNLQHYVDRAVIVSGQLSSTPNTEDMKANLDLDARLEGNAMGLPLSGRISGQATGPVSAPKRFRLLDPKTNRSAAVVVGTYVQNNGIVPPNELRVVSEEFAATYPADQNRLVHALIEAQNLGRDVTVIGRVHPSGQIYAEGITVAGGSEAYLLRVHQHPPLLKPG
ncbi:MAG: hypothetical protein HYU02_08625 [Thaumarchaeota archaeon]|nr:hypothetical protein [Nitrososphaerota archaeon]